MSSPAVAAPRPPTAGPWRIAGKGTIRAGKHDWIARICWFNQDANARLIAAAPDLLAALEIVAKAELYDLSTGIIDADVLEAVQENARAAIAKAR